MPWRSTMRPSDVAVRLPRNPTRSVEVTRRVTGEVEKAKIEEVLDEAGGNKGRAAELLQVSYKSLLAKLKEYRIE